MLVADRNINPRDVIVISVYPGTEGLIKQIKESGLEKAEHLVLRHPKLIRNRLEEILKEERFKVIFCDECLIPYEENWSIEISICNQHRNRFKVDLCDECQIPNEELWKIQDWTWLANIKNTSCDMVMCLKPDSRNTDKVKLPDNPRRMISHFLPTPHRQGFQPGCMSLFYNHVVNNVLGYRTEGIWDEIGVLLKLESERKLPESRPMLWLDIKERDWSLRKVMQQLRDVGVSSEKGNGFFLCSRKMVSNAEKEMPANWKALHQDSMHGLEAEVSNLTAIFI